MARHRPNVPLHAADLAARQLREQTARISLDSINTKDAARRMAAIRNQWPTLGPKVVAALGIAGHGPDDKITKYLAAAQMVKHSKPFWENIPAAAETVKKEQENNLVAQWGAKVKEWTPDIVQAKPEDFDKPKDQWSGGFVSDLAATFKAVARPTFSALETPYQYVVGGARNFARDVSQGNTDDLFGDPLNQSHGVSPIDQTSGGIATKKLVEGKKVDLGTGVFPGGQVEEEQAANSRKAFMVDGHAWTFGRGLASVVTQPGTEPYNVLSGLVDAAAVTKGDPANAVLGGVSGIREARKGFAVGQAAENLDHATGIIDSIRRTVHAPTANRWLTESRGGQKVVGKLAKKESEGGLTYLETLKTVNGNARLAARLHEADDATKVMDILRPALGLELRNQPKVPYAWRRALRNPLDGWRITGTVPQQMADLKDMDGAVSTYDNWLRNAKVSLDDRNALTNELATAGGREDQYAVIKKGAHAVEGTLLDHGVSPAQAKSMTKMFDTWDDFRHYMIDEAGKDVSPFFTVGGKAVEMKSPAHFIDFLNRTVPMPNIRQIRSAVSFSGLHPNLATAAGAVAGGAAGYETTGDLQGTALGALLGASVGNPRSRALEMYYADKFMNVWKPLQLARLGWPLRVIGEEQVRMAMSGFDSMVHHPIHFISRLVQDPTDINGRSFQESMETALSTGDFNAYADAMSGFGRQYITNSEEMGRRLKGFHVLDASEDPEQFARAWHERLARLSTDPIVKYYAEHGSAATKEWFKNGKGNKYLREMVAGPEDVTFQLTSADGADQYIDNIAADIDTLTMGDSELRRALHERHAVVDGKEVKAFHVSKGGKVKLNRDFRNHLEQMTMAGESPQKMIGQLSVGVDAVKRNDWNKGVDYLFTHLMTIPTNKLSRSPVFTQSYYERIGELSPLMTAEHRAAAAAVAEENGFKDIARRIRKVSGDPERTLSPAEVDGLAKAHGLTTTKDLLYDLSERSQFFDIWRNIFPFGEAWKEVLGRWAKITREHPETLRKFQVAVGGLRGADELMGDGNGFFYTDENGQEVFNMPGSDWITKETFGVPVPMTEQVSGLNIAGNGLPGVGPVGQLATSQFLPDKPEYDAIRQFVSPFGDRDMDLTKLSLSNNPLTPSWTAKLFQAWLAPESDAQFANTVKAQLAYLRSTGEYGPNEQRQLLKDAKDNARQFFLVRALASATAPSAPIPNSGVLDKDGNFLYLLRLKDEYNNLKVAGGKNGKTIDDVDQEFLTRYGNDIFGAMQPFNYALVMSLPVFKSQIDWQRSHGDIADKYKATYGFFAPPPKPGEKWDKNSQAAYQRQLDSGERQVIKPYTWNRLFDDKIATHLYYAAKDQVGEHPTKQDRQDLRDYKAYLKDQYPGFESDQGIEGRATTDEMIAEMTKAVKDPALRSNKTAKGIKEILAARAEVSRLGLERGLETPTSWMTSDRMLDERRNLADYYDYIREQFPGTAQALDMVFRNDVRDLTDG